MIKKFIREKVNEFGWDFLDPEVIATSIHAILLLLFCFIVYVVARKVVLNLVHKLAVRTKTHWDDRLMETHFFRRIVLLIPLFILRASVNIILKEYDASIPYVEKVFEILIGIAVVRIIISFINALHAILNEAESMRDKPLQSYFQLVKIIIYLIFGILFFSIITGKTPMFFLTAMGAMSAIVLLIFKDTILGFIGSIQLATNDMVRVGDWISMEKYGADGNVFEINLASIKVRNWDLTITTIPTYALVSDSFKNWRGMQESEGRRMKRAIHIKIGSIHFANEEELEKFKKIKLIRSYIEERSAEIQKYNQENDFDSSENLNGRSLTNVGIFRKYVALYLENHPKVNKDLTYMVRHLEPNEKGLPIEVYAFSKEQEWVVYEGVMADIFDHLLAIIPKFDLEIFQAPTSTDFRKLSDFGEISKEEQAKIREETKNPGEKEDTASNPKDEKEAQKKKDKHQDL
ncbi:mechanosensitive ion channel family protein [bacterium]|nr:mechanosensitive ion channel family protein [bacterium]